MRMSRLNRMWMVGLCLQALSGCNVRAPTRSSQSATLESSSQRAPCPMPLRERIAMIDVDLPSSVVSEYPNRPSSWYDHPSLHPLRMVEAPDQRLLVGWHSAKDRLSIARLTLDRRGVEETVSFAGSLLQDILVLEDRSIVAVYLANSRMRLRRQKLSEASPIFDIPLIGRSSSGLHKGRVARYGTHLAVYFGIHEGGHEGDALLFFDTEGRLQDTGWTWGCSHMIDNRIVTQGTQIFPICVSDYYVAGINVGFATQGGGWGRQHLLHDVQHYNGIGSGQIDGAIALGSHVLVSVNSQYRRSSRDASLFAFAAQYPFTPTPRVWLTATPADEFRGKIARIGDDHILIFEQSTEHPTLRVREASVEVVEGSLRVDTHDPASDPWTVLSARMDPLQDPITDRKGDVMWAEADPNHEARLRIHTISACSP